MCDYIAFRQYTCRHRATLPTLSLPEKELSRLREKLVRGDYALAARRLQHKYTPAYVRMCAWAEGGRFNQECIDMLITIQTERTKRRTSTTRRIRTLSA